MRTHSRHTAHRQPASGFTLVELMVTIAILGMLMYLLSPVLAKAREKARQATCLSNQRQLAMAITMEVKGTSETFPTAQEVWSLVKLGPDILVCPTSEGQGNSYGYNAAISGRPMAAIPSATSTIVTGDALPGLPGNIANTPDEYHRRHNKQFIASFVDGHVKLIKDPPAPGAE
jgi:prepilin-type N-terminal cleavage/methylation domain-containing protein/prepilin-type processing-associated H-X9-DG protein